MNRTFGSAAAMSAHDPKQSFPERCLGYLVLFRRSAANTDLGGWMRSLGLGKYEATFRENKLDETVLPRLTAADLKEG